MCIQLQRHEYYGLNPRLNPKLSNLVELNLLFDIEAFDSRQKSWFRLKKLNTQPILPSFLRPTGPPQTQYPSPQKPTGWITIYVYPRTHTLPYVDLPLSSGQYERSSPGMQIISNYETQLPRDPNITSWTFTYLPRSSNITGWRWLLFMTWTARVTSNPQPQETKRDLFPPDAQTSFFLCESWKSKMLRAQQS